jgi:hypothetical protein
MTGWELLGEPLLVQQKALEKSDGQRGYAYFMEMGLGKSAALLADFLRAMREGARHLIILCPNTLKLNWADECNKWGVALPVYVWPKKPALDNEQEYVFVMNFEAIIHSGGDFLDNLLEMRGSRCMFALDESDRIKNYRAKSTRRIIAMSPRAPWRRVLTGTPMTESTFDLWPQLRFIGALQGVPALEFRNKFCVMGGHMGKQITGPKNEEELGAILSQWAFVARKEQWAPHLPTKTFSTVRVDMHPAAAKHYATMKKEFVAMLESGKLVLASMAITQMEKLQQIARGYIYTGEGEAEELVPPGQNPCVLAVRDAMESCSSKLIVVAYHRHSMSMLASHFSAHAPCVIRGGMGNDAISENKRAFNEDPARRLLILQMGVGGIGHTLIGTGLGPDGCSTMMYYEDTFSLRMRLQCDDRIHREGQRDACTYIDVQAAPIDVLRTAAVARKEDVVEAVMKNYKLL